MAVFGISHRSGVGRCPACKFAFVRGGFSFPGIAAIALALTTGACAPDPAVSSGETLGELEARQEGSLEAMADGDAEAVAGYFAPDAVLHVAGRPPVQGRKQVREFYGNVFQFLSASTATSDRVRLSSGGHMAFVLGSTTNEFQTPDGLVSYQGKFLAVWERVDGEWALAAYSISSDQADG